eukprot:scaffold7923_cov121-Isochrysis_galbana.AAC.14
MRHGVRRGQALRWRRREVGWSVLERGRDGRANLRAGMRARRGRVGAGEAVERRAGCRGRSAGAGCRAGAGGGRDADQGVEGRQWWCGGRSDAHARAWMHLRVPGGGQMVGERRAAQVGAMGERRAAQVGVTRLAQARAAGRREAWIRVQWRSAAASARVEGGAGGLGTGGSVTGAGGAAGVARGSRGGSGHQCGRDVKLSAGQVEEEQAWDVGSVAEEGEQAPVHVAQQPHAVPTQEDAPARGGARRLRRSLPAAAAAAHARVVVVGRAAVVHTEEGVVHVGQAIHLRAVEHAGQWVGRWAGEGPAPPARAHGAEQLAWQAHLSERLGPLRGGLRHEESKHIEAAERIARFAAGALEHDLHIDSAVQREGRRGANRLPDARDVLRHRASALGVNPDGLALARIGGCPGRRPRHRELS